MAIKNNSNGRLSIRGNGDAWIGDTANSITVNTKYYIWWHLNKGATGTGDTTIEAKFTTTNTRGDFTGGDAFSTSTADFTGTIAKIAHSGSGRSDYYVVIDQSIVSTTDLTSVDP